MSETITGPAVLTPEEVADYLRLSPERVLRQLESGRIPGRRIDGEWRVLKATLDDWLKGPDPQSVLLHQAGALADDESLPALLEAIYHARGRPEVEEG
jgi:excisionase family DNA binding protein